MKKTLRCSLLILLLLGFLLGCDLKDLNSTAQTLVAPTPSLVAGDYPTVTPHPNSGLNQYFPLFQLFLYKENSECDEKINTMINTYFNGTDSERILFYGPGADEAYIEDCNPDHLDVRSEGMSYGMMIAVQLDMPDLFQKLWNWTKNHMKRSDGLFNWQCNTNGTVKGQDFAPDGEEYFLMALYFAARRWNNSTYQTEADALSTAMLNPGNNMFNVNGNKLVRFTRNNDYTDPSYHVPAFYTLFSKFASNAGQRSTWAQIATASRKYLATTIKKNTATGLVPNYSDYNGNGTQGENVNFLWDAWRTAMNVELDFQQSNYFFSDACLADYGTFPNLPNSNFDCSYGNAICQFFADHATTPGDISTGYKCLFTVSGTAKTGSSGGIDYNVENQTSRVGLRAMNAFIARSCTKWGLILDFANDLWNAAPPTDAKNKYYDGCLYMLSMLYATGNYLVWGDPSSGPLPSLQQIMTYPFDQPVSITSAWSGKLLTATALPSNADVKGQPVNPSWSSQDWIVEKVPYSTAIRLKNVWTGKYLHVQNQNENAKVVCYDFRPDWLSEQWIVEPIDTSNDVRLKNAWSGRYLTIENTGTYANIWSQSLNPGWASQKWQIGNLY